MWFAASAGQFAAVAEVGTVASAVVRIEAAWPLGLGIATSGHPGHDSWCRRCTVGVVLELALGLAHIEAAVAGAVVGIEAWAAGIATFVLRTEASAEAGPGTVVAGALVAGTATLVVHHRTEA